MTSGIVSCGRTVAGTPAGVKRRRAICVPFAVGCGFGAAACLALRLGGEMRACPALAGWGLGSARGGSDAGPRCRGSRLGKGAGMLPPLALSTARTSRRSLRPAPLLGTAKGRDFECDFQEAVSDRLQDGRVWWKADVCLAVSTSGRTSMLPNRTLQAWSRPEGSMIRPAMFARRNASSADLSSISKLTIGAPDFSAISL